MRFSYGSDMCPIFDPAKHEQRRKYTSALDGTDRCRGVFTEIIQQNESVALGTNVKHSYSTGSPNQSSMSVNVYASTKEKPIYVDEDGCVLIGTAEIEIPFQTEERRDVSIEYIFGNT